MTNTIIQRIEREAGISGLLTALVKRVKPTDLQSLLLEVFRQRANDQPAPSILASYESNRFVRPASISPLRLLEWEQTAFSTLPPDFQAIELSPVCPLGTCSSVALVDQNRVVSTIRNTEVVADSTNVLALECAAQRRELLRTNPKSKTAVHLAASHRLLRAQHYSGARSWAHFSVFGLCSSGQDQENVRFEFAALILHIGFYLRALRAFLGSAFGLQVEVTDFSATDRSAYLMADLISPLQAGFADVDFMLDSERVSGKDYYADLCFHIYLTTPSGERVETVDGGAVNWTQRLMSNSKERCVISGIGSERVCSL